jgi:hypothetical protein
MRHVLALFLVGCAAEPIRPTAPCPPGTAVRIGTGGHCCAAGEYWYNDHCGKHPEEVRDSESTDAQLSKGEIVRGLSAVRGKVTGCYDRFGVAGMAEVQLRIAQDGTVSVRSVGGLGATGPAAREAACVGEVVSLAIFRTFTGPPMNITYPFMLR